MVRISRPHPQITIYDDVFDYRDQQSIFRVCNCVPYALGWRDNTFHGDKEVFFHHVILAEEWENPHPRQKVFFDKVKKTLPFVEFKGRVISSGSVFNCDTIADSHTLHNHEGEDVILYYANLKWEDGWSGETFFYDKKGENIICTVQYTPNRMVVFDGELLHRFNGPSRIADKFRFSISTFFNKEHAENEVLWNDPQ